MSYLKGRVLIFFLNLFFSASCSLTIASIVNAKGDRPFENDTADDPPKCWVCDRNISTSTRAKMYEIHKNQCEDYIKAPYNPDSYLNVDPYMDPPTQDTVSSQSSSIEEIGFIGCGKACDLNFYEDICKNGRSSCESVISNCSMGMYLTNTARYIGKDQWGRNKWEWTAFMKELPNLQSINAIDTVTYELDHTFRPNLRTGNRNQQGHPITTTGGGTFELKAHVTFKNGRQRTYSHMLRFE